MNKSQLKTALNPKMYSFSWIVLEKCISLQKIVKTIGL